MNMLLRRLGDAQSDKAWEAYLLALRDNLKSSWSRAVSAYNGLKAARTTLGLPFIVDGAVGEGAGAPGMTSASAWTSDLEQQAVDLMAMVTLVNTALEDAAAGKRKLNYIADKGEFQIEALPSDLLRLEIHQNGPVLVDAATGGNAKVSGQVGAPAIVWFATATVSVLALPAYFIVERAVSTLTDVAEQKTMKTTVEKSYECVQSGKCTPEQAAKINQSVYQGAAAVKQEKTKQIEASNKPTTDWTSAIETVALVALGIAALYAIIRLVPPAGPRVRTTALARRAA